MEATAYNWLHFYSFHYNQFWSELNQAEFDWVLGANAVLVSTEHQSPTDIAGSIAAPCCLINNWNTEFWMQEVGIIYKQRPAVRLLEDWTQVDCPWMGSKGKKLIPSEYIKMVGQL